MLTKQRGDHMPQIRPVSDLRNNFAEIPSHGSKGFEMNQNICCEWSVSGHDARTGLSNAIVAGESTCSFTFNASGYGL